MSHYSRSICIVCYLVAGCADVAQEQVAVSAPEPAVLPADADGWMSADCAGEHSLSALPLSVARGASLVSSRRVSSSPVEDLVERVPHGTLITPRLELRLEDPVILAGPPVDSAAPVWLLLTSLRRYERDTGERFVEHPCVDAHGRPATLASALDEVSARGAATILAERLGDGYVVRDVVAESEGWLHSGARRVSLEELRTRIAEAERALADGSWGVPPAEAGERPPMGEQDPVPEEEESDAPRR